MGQCMVPEPNGRCESNAGKCGPALTAEVAGEWDGLEYAGVSRGLPLQSRCADGAGERLPRLVAAPSPKKSCHSEHREESGLPGQRHISYWQPPRFLRRFAPSE